MARPRKNNADYFSHDNDMRNDPKIKSIRNRFGLEGYAIYCMMLEVLTKADDFRISFTELDIELLTGDFGIDPEKFNEMIVHFCRLNLFQIEGETLVCYKLIDRLQPLLAKREKNRPGEVLEAETGVSVTETEFKAPENPQSKVKKSIGKLNKEKSKKETQKLSQAIDLPDSFKIEKFTAVFNKLLAMPKWRKKPESAVDLTIKKLARYDVDFSIQLIESAIMGNYQGVVFPDTDAKYESWKKMKNGGAPSQNQNGSGRAQINHLGNNPDAYKEPQAF